MTEIATTLSDEPDMAVSSVPNGKNTIPGTDANMKSDDEDRTMRRVPSGTNIAPEHKKWFAAVHNCWMGHRGVSATLDSLRQKQCIWNTMKEDVKQMIALCPTCQKLSVKKLEYNTHPFTTSTYQPHERINIDTLDLNQPDKDGNIAIIVIIDTFTRWIELYPIKDHTDEVAAGKILEHFGRYGAPKEILTDRGKQFVNKLVQKVCDTYGVLFRKTPIAHSHQQNAKVENANRQVLRSLRAFILDERAMDDWTRALPAVQFIFNTTIHRDIGYSSADLLFGPAVNMSRFILEKKDINDPVESIVWWDQQQDIQ